MFLVVLSGCWARSTGAQRNLVVAHKRVLVFILR